MAATATPISCGEKCQDACGKIGDLCAILPQVTCGDFKMGFEKVGNGNVKVFKSVPPCIGDLYRRFFVQHGRNEWLHYENSHYTFRQAYENYMAVGAEIRTTYGVNVGESVGICMKNMPEFLMSFMAITSVGCRAVPLNSLWTRKELEYAMKDSECKVLFCDPQRLDIAAPFLKDLNCKVVLCGGDQAKATEAGAALWDKVVADGQGKPRPSIEGVNADSDCLIMYTSGSTGFPKGVVHSQRGLGNALMLQGFANLLTKDKTGGKIILAVPLFHITALVNIFLNSIAGGIQMFMLKKWDAGLCLDIIEKNQVTRFIGVPTMIRDMFEHKDFTPERVASIKSMAGGGAAMPPSLLEKVRSVTKSNSSQQGYGLTETCGGVIVNKGLDYVKNPTSCGKPIPLSLVQVRIIDPETKQVVAEGERGELCILSAFNMSRYHNRPEDTEKAVDENGFFHTGDVAKFDKGFIYILDRLKDIIIRGGENIDCSEVETCLYSNPAVRECSVFGLPDKRLGEVVAAAIFLQGSATAQELSDYCASKLAKFKVPEAQRIFLLDAELPKGPTGKIDKKGMRENYSALEKAKETESS